MAASSSLITRPPVSDVSPTRHRFFRVWSSTTAGIRNRRPSLSASCKKSIDQRWFGPRAGAQWNTRHRSPLASDAPADLQPSPQRAADAVSWGSREGPHATAEPVTGASQGDGAAPPACASARGRPCRPIDCSDSRPGPGPLRSRGPPAAGSPHLPCRDVPRPPAEAAGVTNF